MIVKSDFNISIRINIIRKDHCATEVINLIVYPALQRNPSLINLLTTLNNHKSEVYCSTLIGIVHFDRKATIIVDLGLLTAKVHLSLTKRTFQSLGLIPVWKRVCCKRMKSGKKQFSINQADDI